MAIESLRTTMFALQWLPNMASDMIGDCWLYPLRLLRGRRVPGNRNPTFNLTPRLRQRQKICLEKLKKYSLQVCSVFCTSRLWHRWFIYWAGFLELKQKCSIWAYWHWNGSFWLQHAICQSVPATPRNTTILTAVVVKRMRPDIWIPRFLGDFY